MTPATDQDTIVGSTVDDVRSLEETARFFRVSVPTMRRWIADGCPVMEKGSSGQAYKLRLRAVAAWRNEQEASAAAEEEEKAAVNAQLALELLGGVSAADPETVGLTPKQRDAIVLAELNAIKLGIARKEWVRFETGRSYVARAFQQLRARIRSIPDRLAIKFGWTEDVTAAFLEELDLALDDCAAEMDGMHAALTAEGDASS